MKFHANISIRNHSENSDSRQKIIYYFPRIFFLGIVAIKSFR